MTLKLYWYPNCSTCKKAKKLLDDNQMDYELIHLVTETPSAQRIQEMMTLSELEAKKFFNTSGKSYREKNMKDKIKDASIDEMAEFLAADGMLIKRPIVTDDKKVTVGFKEDEFKTTWLN